MLDLVKATSRSNGSNGLSKTGSSSAYPQRTVADAISQADAQLKSLYQLFHDFATSLSDDVTVNELKLYVAFKRLKNFACVSVQTNTRCLMVWLKLDPDTVELENGFSRDMRGIGHWGTGDLELMIKTPEDLEKAKPLILKSYEIS
jgi:predicted transport protein